MQSEPCKSTSHWLSDTDSKLRTQLVMMLIVSLVGKVLGFVRIQQIAATLGVGIYSDVLLVALQIVWLLETILISSAVVPMIVSRIYQVDEHEGGEAAIAFFLHAALVCIGISIIATGLALIFAEQLASAIAPGLDIYGRKVFATLLLMSAMTPLLLMLAHFLGLLNRLLCNGVWYAVPQIITNSTAIAGLFAGYTLFGEATGARWMMIGLSLGAFMVCIVQLWALPRTPRARLFRGFMGHLAAAVSFRGRWPLWSGVGALALVAFVNEAYIYIDFYFASNLAAGSISLLGFASRLATLTNGLIMASALVILEPRWAKELATAGQTAWQTVMRPDMLSLVALISVPMAVLLVFPGDVTSFIYNSDEFAPVAREKIILLTQVFAFGTIALALNLITTRAVVIAQEQRWIFMISLSLLPVKIGLNILFVDYFGVVGLAVATVTVIFLQALGNIIVLMRAKVRLAFRLRDVLALGATFAIMVLSAYGLAGVMGGGLVGLFLSCLLLSCVVLMLGTVFGFSYATIISQRIGRF